MPALEDVLSLIEDLLPLATEVFDADFLKEPLFFCRPV